MARSRRRSAGFFFQPDPWVRPPAAHESDEVLLQRAGRVPQPWPWRIPPPHPDLFGRTRSTVRWRATDPTVTIMRAVGTALVVAGIATVGYLSFTAWRDTRAAEQSQDRLGAEFEQSAAAAATTAPAFVEDPTIGTTSLPPPAAATTAPGAATTTTPAPAIIGEVPPAPGGALGRIVIPALGMDWMIVEGVSRADLAQGPGHMPGTALPGQPGNAVISGHRTTYGAPFGDLELLAPGDEISVTTLIGTHSYEVVETVIVAPDDVWVTNQVAGAWLTLTTCHPEGSSQQRLVVFARLVDGPNAGAITGTATPPQPA